MVEVSGQHGSCKSTAVLQSQLGAGVKQKFNAVEIIAESSVVKSRVTLLQTTEMSTTTSITTLQQRLPLLPWLLGLPLSTVDSLVVSVLELGSEGPRFEPVSHVWSRSKRWPVALCTLGLALLNPPSLNGR